jgi:metal-responsive CopG/Arc/MetJ family transcriptional regulator
MATRTIRLSATLPKKVLEEVDEIAALDKVSRSQLISKCLMEMVKNRKAMLLAQGYQAMAKQHAEFAELAEDAAREALPKW